MGRKKPRLFSAPRRHWAVDPGRLTGLNSRAWAGGRLCGTWWRLGPFPVQQAAGQELVCLPGRGRGLVMLGVASPGSMARWVSGDTAIGVPVGSCSLCVGAVFDSLQRGPWSWAHSCFLGRAVRTETDSLSSSPLHHHPAPAPGDPVSLDTFEEWECFWGKENVYVGGRRHGAFPRLGTSGGHLGGSSQTSQHLVADFQTSQAPIWAHLGKFKAFQFCHLAWGRGWGRLFCTFFQA